MELLNAVLLSGWQALIDYVWHHTLTCLVPAFFIAGGIAAFVSKDSVMKYFGPHANKFLSYSVASISGTILAVCSCTVLPLFAGIYRRGAGLGPAIAFLFSGPAINILAISYTWRLLGYDIGLARVLFAVGFAWIVGLLMALIYHREEAEKKSAFAPVYATNGAGESSDFKRLVFLIVLVLVLLTATSHLGFWVKWSLVAAEIAFIIYSSLYWFDREEVRYWLEETWTLIKQIVPVLLIGVFVAGAIKVLLPPEWVTRFVGSNNFTGNFIASISGALMYFSTLTEVPIVRSLLDLGMNKGPALALLLAGPALSLPSMFALSRIMGVKKTLVYVTIVVLLATLSGMIFGILT